MRLKLLILFLLLPILSNAEVKLPLGYPLTTCMSCGEPLGEAPAILIYGGRQLKFCSLECVTVYTKSPETAISNLEEQIKVSQRDSYPLKECVVTGNKLGGMGEPVEIVYGNTLVRFCCGACIEKFEKNPEQYIKKISHDESGLPALFVPKKN